MTQLSRSMLAFGAVVTVSAVLPLSLTACSSAHLDAQAAELHASADSDVLSMPTELVYDVAEVRVVEPTGAAALHSALGSDIDSSGYFVLNDGMITEAELDVAVSGVAEAVFVLTEPTVLRGGFGEQGEVIVTGVLTVDGVAQQHTKVRLVPVSLTEDSAEFDVSFTLPDNPLISGADVPFDTVSARLVLTAR